jgi:hypothetical protein
MSERSAKTGSVETAVLVVVAVPATVAKPHRPRRRAAWKCRRVVGPHDVRVTVNIDGHSSETNKERRVTDLGAKFVGTWAAIVCLNKRLGTRAQAQLPISRVPVCSCSGVFERSACEVFRERKGTRGTYGGARRGKSRRSAFWRFWLQSAAA